ncbi:MAG: sugar ABC transporter ATP-binding protein [Clostridiales Family XIII bacterium]|nr:sugar ABC transporter ATP-binding protein [Clostridiales Family XIII bacterium]
MASGQDQYILEMRSISKAFVGVQALSDVDFFLKKGTVHALMGENGAGKSTLMKILTGMYHEDSGDVMYQGEPFKHRSELLTLHRGISMIHQELSYVPELTIADNIFLGREVSHLGILDTAEMNRRAEELLDKLNVKFDPKRKMSDLMVSEQQMIEIAKAISYDANIIIMDEPTSAITDREIDQLFGMIKDLKGRGVSIIYISHKMDEILRIADYVTVFRDGKNVNSYDAKDIDIGTIIRDMVGRDLVDVFSEKKCALGEEVLRVENFSRVPHFKDVSFSVHRGEIVGFAGLMGAGRTEIMRCLFGMDKPDSGEIYIKGEKVDIDSPRSAIGRSIGFVSEDRKGVGLVLPLSVRDNITLSSLSRLFKSFLLKGKQENAVADEIITKMRIKTPNRYQCVNNLSGGNQQKVVIGKAVLEGAEILIMDEPTRGIDIGTKSEIYKLIVDLAEQGNAVILVSSELPELVGLSDKVVVLHEGEQTGVIAEKRDISQESIMELAIA